MTAHRTPPETFGDRLRRLRAAAGLTQRQLAARSALAVGTVRQWEQGRRGPSLTAARRLAAALGVTLDVLAGPVE